MVRVEKIELLGRLHRLRISMRNAVFFIGSIKKNVHIAHNLFSSSAKMLKSAGPTHSILCRGCHDEPVWFAIGLPKSDCGSRGIFHPAGYWPDDVDRRQDLWADGTKPHRDAVREFSFRVRVRPEIMHAKWLFFSENGAIKQCELS